MLADGILGYRPGCRQVMMDYRECVYGGIYTRGVMFNERGDRKMHLYCVLTKIFIEGAEIWLVKR